MSIVTVESYLTRYGWNFERSIEDVIVTGFTTDETRFLLLIQWAAPWLRLSVPAYLPLPTSMREPDIGRMLLKLNAQSRLARFAVDENDQLIVCVDVYTEPELTYETFEVSLDALTYLAETAYPYLSTVLFAEEPELIDDAS